MSLSVYLLLTAFTVEQVYHHIHCAVRYWVSTLPVCPVCTLHWPSPTSPQALWHHESPTAGWGRQGRRLKWGQSVFTGWDKPSHHLCGVTSESQVSLKRLVGVHECNSVAHCREHWLLHICKSIGRAKEHERTLPVHQSLNFTEFNYSVGNLEMEMENWKWLYNSHWMVLISCRVYMYTYTPILSQLL